MKMEAETGGMQPQAKEPLKPPGAGRGRKGSLLEALGGTWPHPHLDFRFIASRTMKKIISALLSHAVCSHLL